MTKFASITAFAVLVSSTPVFGQETISDEILRALMQGPSEETANAISNLQIHDAPIRPGGGGNLSSVVKNLKTNNSEIGQVSNSIGPSNTIPFSIPDTVLLQLAPDLNKSEITQYLAEKNLKLLEVFPNIGQIKVFSEDLEKFYIPKAGDDDANYTILRGNLELGSSFKEDPRIIAASPDFFISSESLGPVPTVSSHVDLSTNVGETSDWGIDDIRASTLWTDPLALDGILVGALDTGFLRHDDLVFTDVPVRLAIDDHGNHVFGIMCARHNGEGTRGVLPNCFGAPRSANVFPIADSQGNVQRFMIRFSQIISALNQFVDDRSDSIKMFNISMGYNWMSNFGINPDELQNALYRGNAAQHGEMLLSTLNKVTKRKALIVSAAGNDSTGLATPINAKYASPFNWAAITTRERGIDTNALVIEAHAEPSANADVGSRASFSNVGGDLSCPGVNILSTVARDSAGQESSSAYGTMSGTSMAAPYCASGTQLFAMVRPGYEINEVVDCLINSAAPSTTGAGQLRLDAAATACPRR